MIRDTVVDALRDFLTENVDRVLTDLLGNVDIGALSQGFNVPSITGGDDIRLVINAALSTLRFSLKTYWWAFELRSMDPWFLATAVLNPLLPGEENVVVPNNRTVGAAVIGVLNQACIVSGGLDILKLRREVW